MNPDSRRNWIKKFVLGSAAALGGEKWTATVLAEVRETFPREACIRIRPADYPPLGAVGGSVQLQFNEIVKPLTLNRVDVDRFVALDSICKHAGCTVGRFITDNGHMRCPCHGSRYDIEGRVFRDSEGNPTEPAHSDLGRFASSYDPEKDTVSITVPDLALEIHAIQSVGMDDQDRILLRLRFPVTAFSRYEILYYNFPGRDGVVVSFSLTAEGTPDRTEITPTRDGDFTAYVSSSGTVGFFAVRLKLVRFS